MVDSQGGHGTDHRAVGTKAIHCPLTWKKWGCPKVIGAAQWSWCPNGSVCFCVNWLAKFDNGLELGVIADSTNLPILRKKEPYLHYLGHINLSSIHVVWSPSNTSSACTMHMPLAYLDDIIIHISGWQQHLHNLRTIVRWADLTANPKKVRARSCPVDVAMRAGFRPSKANCCILQTIIYLLFCGFVLTAGEGGTHHAWPLSGQSSPWGTVSWGTFFHLCSDHALLHWHHCIKDANI